MESLLQQINDHKLAITAFTANNTDEVEQFRIKWLGTKGLVKAIMGEMRNVPNEQKKEFGQILNEFKLFAEARFQALQDQFAGASTATAGKSAPLFTNAAPAAVKLTTPVAGSMAYTPPGFVVKL